MKYALFEFLEEKDEAGLAVGESAWIVDIDVDVCDNESFDFDETVEVQWPGVAKRSLIYTVKIHRFSGESLCCARFQDLGRS